MILPRLPQADARAVDDSGRPALSHRRYHEQIAQHVQATSDSLTASQTDIAAHWLYARLLGSYCTGCTITGHDNGTDATITISAHSRVYIDGTVSVNSGSVTDGRAASVWLYYDDAAHAGGAVTYGHTTTWSTAFPSSTFPNRHFVGAILTPATSASDTTGLACKPPAFIDPAA